MEDEPESSDDDQPRKRRSPRDQYDDVELGSAVAFTPDGPVVALGPPAVVPAATVDNFICLRGPCRHYWQIETFLLAENPKETWDGSLVDPLTGQPVKQPNQITRTCLVHPGTEMELTDDCVFACSKWDPMQPKELRALEKRRRKHLKLYPGG